MESSWIYRADAGRGQIPGSSSVADGPLQAGAGECGECPRSSEAITIHS